MRYLLFCISMFLLWECKDKNTAVVSPVHNNAPVIHIFSPPYNNMMFSYDSTIDIKVKVTDDVNVKKVHITMTKEGSTTPDMEFQKTIGKDSCVVDTSYTFNVNQVTYYKLKVEAWDNMDSLSTTTFGMHAMD